MEAELTPHGRNAERSRLRNTRQRPQPCRLRSSRLVYKIRFTAITRKWARADAEASMTNPVSAARMIRSRATGSLAMATRALITRGQGKTSCMFWYIVAFGLTAIECGILRNRNGVHAFYSVYLTRSHTLSCTLLQHAQVWTQYPPTLAVIGVRPLPAPTKERA